MKKDRTMDLFLEQLRKVPIVQVSCEKVGISRNTVYRWRKDEPDFAKAMDEALAEGEAIINDMGESQLLTLMKEKNWNAISFWLRKRSPKFRDRLEVVSTMGPQEELSPEQEATVREALRLASLNLEEIHEPQAQEHVTEPTPLETPTEKSSSEINNDNNQNHESK